MRIPRERSKWAKVEDGQEGEEEEGTSEKDKEGTEEEGEGNYWDMAAKKRASMQDKYKQDLLDLMKRRMMHLYPLFPSRSPSPPSPPFRSPLPFAFRMG
jgi:hypothetical protein